MRVRKSTSVVYFQHSLFSSAVYFPPQFIFQRSLFSSAVYFPALFIFQRCLLSSAVYYPASSVFRRHENLQRWFVLHANNLPTLFLSKIIPTLKTSLSASCMSWILFFLTYLASVFAVSALIIPNAGLFPMLLKSYGESHMESVNLLYFYCFRLFN